MRQILFLVLVISSTFASFAQKKLVPVEVSDLTGIQLPDGSLQDKRMLSVSSAKMLLDIESNKTGRTVSDTEVLVLPPVASGGFDNNMLVKELSEKGWQISIIRDDNKYAWLQMGTRFVMMYFSMSAGESNLFFCNTTVTAIQNIQKNNNSNIQNPQNPQTQLPKSADNPVETKQIVFEQQPVLPVSKTGFAFATTNFDDGWVATERPDWVQVSKENTVVLIHYSQPNIRDFNNLDEKTAFVWNTLVAPRYSNIANLWIRKSWYADGDFMNGKYFAEADLTENSSGRKVHVVIYKSGSAGRWLEFITPDKPTFQNQFAVVYQQDGTNWDKLSVMGNYNKFAVSASDLPGKWTNDFSAAIQYVNVYTGLDAGMDTNSSKENFLIGSDSRYNWDLGVANGQVGNMKYQNVKSTGTFSMNNNWQITFSDIEGKPRTCNTYFTCIKGLRILWLDDKSFAKVQ